MATSQEWDCGSEIHAVIFTSTVCEDKDQETAVPFVCDTNVQIPLCTFAPNSTTVPSAVSYWPFFFFPILFKKELTSRVYMNIQFLVCFLF